MENKDVVTLSMSVLAMGISITSLWLNNMRPFRPEIVAGDPTLYFVPLKGLSGAIRWIPAVDVQVSLFNVGKVVGKVYDIRMRFYREDKKQNSFTLHAEHVVDFSKFILMRLDRDNWKTAIVRQWSPFLLMPTSGTTMHIVLGGVGFDQPVEGHHTLVLEAFTSKRKKWIMLKTFDVQLWANMYGKPTFTLLDEKLEKIREQTD